MALAFKLPHQNKNPTAYRPIIWRAALIAIVAIAALLVWRQSADQEFDSRRPKPVIVAPASDSVVGGPNTSYASAATVEHGPAEGKGVLTVPEQRSVVAVDGTQTRAATENQSTTLDDSVIGRPFVVSASMKLLLERCLSGLRPGTAGTCGNIPELLQRLSDEPRDVIWADRSERMLEQGIRPNNREKLEFRSIECRQTLCAVEAASPDGFPNILTYEDIVRSGLLITGPFAMAFEHNDSGWPTFVYVFAFDRLDFTK